MTLPTLLSLSLRRPTRFLRRWYHGKMEQHYLAAAAVEKTKAAQARFNEQYYHSRAALARSDKRNA